MRVVRAELHAGLAHAAAVREASPEVVGDPRPFALLVGDHEQDVHVGTLCQDAAVETVLEPRMLALVVARARVAVGAIGWVLPGPAAAFAHGDRASAARSLAAHGGRAHDVALGLGALTSVKEGTQDAEWVGMGAVVDIVDGLALLLTRGLPKRARLLGLAALGCGVAGLSAARALADARDASDGPSRDLTRSGLAGVPG